MSVVMRARDLGIAPGVLAPGPSNSITDIDGVLVGQVTLIDGTDIRTGVTAIRPHRGNLHAERVPAGVAVGNGYGKIAGSTQIEELGEIEAPILLTNTMAVAAAIEGSVRWTLDQPGNSEVRSVNAVVGETNDGLLNDIRRFSVRPEHVRFALESATAGPVQEGSVGAGTGTQAFGWKGGIGTSSRRAPTSLQTYTVGVLVQTNFGGVLSIAGAPVGQALGGNFLLDDLLRINGDGSVNVIIATDAPVSDRNLSRLAKRAFLGLGRTGSPMTNGSGDYAVAFSTAPSVRRIRGGRACAVLEELVNSEMSPLFLAVVEATEEAVYNALFCATTIAGHRGVLHSLPREDVLEILRKHRVVT